jgi:hypothetical protein
MDDRDREQFDRYVCAALTGLLAGNRWMVSTLSAEHIAQMAELAVTFANAVCDAVDAVEE